jgi:hypothetical protein
MLPFEFQALEKYVTTHANKIWGGDVSNHTKSDLRFCVALDHNLGWVLAIRIVGARSKLAKIAMDFKNYPITCHFVTTCYTFWEHI